MWNGFVSRLGFWSMPKMLVGLWSIVHPAGNWPSAAPLTWPTSSSKQQATAINSRLKKQVGTFFKIAADVCYNEREMHF